ncbi:MAG: hypothetical protein WEA10_00480 [Actinomycetota bacterium]
MPEGVRDPRLVDAVSEWLALNRDLLSVHRLRNLFRSESGSAKEPVSILRGVEKRAKRFVTASKALEPDPMLPSNLAVRLRLLMDAGSRSEVARFLLTWPGSEADAHHVAGAAAFAKRNVNDILLSFVRARVVVEAWAGNRRLFSADKQRWCAFLGLRPEELPGYVPWIRLFRATVRILRWLDDAELADKSRYLRSSGARDLIEDVRADLVACGVDVPDPQRYPGDASLGSLDDLVSELTALLTADGALGPLKESSGHSV